MINRNDYTEMEVLVNGEWRKQDVLKTLEDGTCLYLMGDKTENGSYLAGACVPGQAYRELEEEVEPTTVTRVKSAPEIMQILEDNYYSIDDEGDWVSPDFDLTFFNEMWKYCGNYPNESQIWEEEWLEEVEIDN